MAKQEIVDRLCGFDEDEVVLDDEVQVSVDLVVEVLVVAVLREVDNN
ncbi:MAG: hypothetical protein WCL18_09205 [bacterium]